MPTLVLLCVLLLAQDKVSFDEKILATVPDGTIARDVTFYKDGRLVAYRAVANGKMHVVINALKHPDYPSIAEGLRWTNDGRIAYRATNGSQWFAVVGGTPGPATQSVGMPVFSPDGKKVAYEGSRGIGAAGDITSCTV
jgi:Tol biopolymer transport system component